MDLMRIGYHTSVKNLLGKSDEFFTKYKVFQVFVGSPRSLQEPSYTDLSLLMKRHSDIEVIVHGPYCVNLCKSNAEKCYISTLSYYIKLAKALDRIGIKYIVTHIGGRSDQQTNKDSAIQILNFCQKWLMSTSECKIKLCLENDSGSKKGTKMGYVPLLATIVKRMDNPRIRMTFDTEHAYAAGYDLKDKEVLKEFVPYVDIVHLNSVPNEVEKGGHLDRHSTTSFYQSKEDPISVLEVFGKNSILFIMEVESEILVKSNYEWLKEFFK